MMAGSAAACRCHGFFFGNTPIEKAVVLATSLLLLWQYANGKDRPDNDRRISAVADEA